MARLVHDRDIAPVLSAAERWIKNCLVRDGALFGATPLWTPELVEEVFHAFVEHPDTGPDDFITKLKRQMAPASPSAQCLVAEMLWALLLFPSNIKANTKLKQIRVIWAMSGRPPQSEMNDDPVLSGIGSGGTGFNAHRPDELAYLIEVTRDLKRRPIEERETIFSDYDKFMSWIEPVPRKGERQFRHMLRFFGFPDRVERMSSNNDRRSILAGYEVASRADLGQWTDRQLDSELLKLRTRLEAASPGKVLDFYMPELKQLWAGDRALTTAVGDQVTVTVPSDEEDQNENGSAPIHDVRQSLRIQAKLADIGGAMNFSVWIPPGDRNRVRELMSDPQVLLERLPLNSDPTTLATIEQIDVIWIKRRSIVRAFEVEHTTAVYSGLLRMADLLALQPNIDIKLHIVAPDERRDKVFKEIRRPVFSFLERGPLSRSCTFISYENVDTIRALEHLPHTTDSIIAEYEEHVEE
jgi:hypothetical protein